MDQLILESYVSQLEYYLELRDLSINTKKSYQSFLKSYLEWLNSLGIQPKDASYENIRTYILYLKKTKKLSNHSINAHTSQIRFFRLYILKQPWDRYEVPAMRIKSYLPEVLSLDETMAFINSIKDLRLKACVALLYSSGLRLSELCHLRFEDIHYKDGRIFIRASKNRSERYATLSKKAVLILSKYYYQYGKPRGWLFPSRKGDQPVSSAFFGRLITRHLKSLNWTKHVTAHSFRYPNLYKIQTFLDKYLIYSIRTKKGLDFIFIFSYCQAHKNLPMSHLRFSISESLFYHLRFLE